MTNDPTFSLWLLGFANIILSFVILVNLFKRK